MNLEKVKAIRDRYFALSESRRTFASARVLGTNLARMDFFEHKMPISTEEYAKILAASWFFKDLEDAITSEELEATSK